MGAIRYFKKLSPGNVVVCENGSRVEFTTVDGLLGWFAADNDYLHGQFEKMMREQRYAISEVSVQEFSTEYLEKKSQLPPGSYRGNWREEWGKGASNLTSPVQRLGSEAVAAVVGLDGSKADVRPTAPTPAAVSVAEPAAKAEKAKEEFKPTIGKRPKKAGKEL